MDSEKETLFDDATGDIAVGELGAAIEKYRRCVEIDPDFFDGWHALGMALMKNGQFPEAIEAGLRATELDPQSQIAWTSLSLCYVRNHQIKEAEAAGAKARILSWGGKIKFDQPLARPSSSPPPSTIQTAHLTSATPTRKFSPMRSPGTADSGVNLFFS